MSLGRQKRTLTLILIVTVLIYANWFVSVKKFENTIELNNAKLANAYLAKSNELAERDRRQLAHESGLVDFVAAASVIEDSNYNNSIDEIENHLSNRPIVSLNRLNQLELLRLLEILNANKVCLLQVNILKQISRVVNKTSSFEFDLLKIFNLRNLDGRSSETNVSGVPSPSFLTFGVGYLRVAKLQKVIIFFLVFFLFNTI